ncbi:MAG TPA: hypothetical protein VIY86_08285, partial [Pirellulaceae bacterium]
MEKHLHVLLAIWRAACQHLEIQESAATIAAHLAPHLPRSRMVIRRIQASPPAIETVADQLVVPGTSVSPTTDPEKSPLSPQQWKRLQ